jgi:hypothetical protein
VSCNATAVLHAYGHARSTPQAPPRRCACIEPRTDVIPARLRFPAISRDAPGSSSGYYTRLLGPMPWGITGVKRFNWRVLMQGGIAKSRSSFFFRVFGLDNFFKSGLHFFFFMFSGSTNFFRSPRFCNTDIILRPSGHPWYLSLYLGLGLSIYPIFRMG